MRSGGDSLQRHLFLTGPAGAGKTALLRRCLGPAALGYAGGFVTEPAFDTDRTLLGYDLFPGAAAADFALYSGWRYLDLSGPVPVRDNDLFREKAVELLEQAEYYPFAMVDSIGGYELLIPQFRGALANFLNLSLPIIGVLKDADSVREEQRRCGLGPRFPAAADMVRQAMERDKDTLIVPMVPGTEDRAEELVKSWVQEYIRFL